MRFSTVKFGGRARPAIAVDGKWAPIDLVVGDVATDLLSYIRSEPTEEQQQQLYAAAAKIVEEEGISGSKAEFDAPFRHPRMIWGIGLNYAEHAQDLHAGQPEQPGSFIKADHTVIGPNENIVIPTASKRTTTEAEVGLVIGRTARNVAESEAMSYVFGVCAILDQTAEDILELNPRYLTRSKNFETFFSFGPEIVTLDELPEADLNDIEVTTVVSGKVIRTNIVGNMRHRPESLVSFHSHMMPLYPGDIISTGTPGAGVISSGDIAEAHVQGLAVLRNPVA